ncbi:MAG TPA: nickel pincer cofactor biosynthesis protein LarC [Streptosporangiaceae bacterium]|nr:nickel pincer cofactor biosynthesis protein LarC [Streptosporangiaceae bacterium]
MPGELRTMWLDVSAGVAGDMVLGALVDAGASLDFIGVQVDAVLAGAVALSARQVTRAGLRGTQVSVSLRKSDPVPRAWRDIQELLSRAPIPDPVRRDSLAVFSRLAVAEARVHGIEPDDVHFHEVGALDSIADIVGSCAGLHDLGIADIQASPLALGSGTVRAEHGILPVPVPAVLEMVGGWTVSGGGTGELATPTGVALVTALASGCGPLPVMQVVATGVGAGSKDTPDRANVVRAVIGDADAGSAGGLAAEVVIEANVDDLDPRLWPAVLTALLQAGAQDAWLTPILMKKGRPAHTLHVLARPEDAAALRAVVLAQTSTIGMRSFIVDKYALARMWVPVEIAGQVVRIKVAHDGAVIRQATPEYADVEAAAAQLTLPVRQVLRLADAGAAQSGLVVGGPVPGGPA